jgi:nicotinamide mononucleotide transporter
MTIDIRPIKALIGTKDEYIESMKVAVGMAIVVFLYEIISSVIIPDFQLNWFEIIGTWTGLICVWLARTQNILTWPWGIISVGMLGYFFATIGLPGQQWLNWGYFLIIQFWAWPQWSFGGKQATVLPVTLLTNKARLILLAIALLATGVIYFLIDIIVPGSTLPLLDATVVASSIVAQYLLGLKKVESWLLWLGPVNLLSIILFFIAGAYTVMALYIAYFIHAIWALRTWYQEAR